MSRYQGYSEPIEVLIDILNEQRKQTLLLEKIAEQKEIPQDKIVPSPNRSKSISTNRRKA